MSIQEILSQTKEPKEVEKIVAKPHLFTEQLAVHSSPEVRFWIIDQMSEKKGTKTRNLFRTLLDDENPDIVKKVVAVYGAMYGNGALTDIAHALARFGREGSKEFYESLNGIKSISYTKFFEFKLLIRNLAAEYSKYGDWFRHSRLKAFDSLEQIWESYSEEDKRNFLLYVSNSDNGCYVPDSLKTFIIEDSSEELLQELLSCAGLSFEHRVLLFGKLFSASLVVRNNILKYLLKSGVSEFNKIAKNYTEEIPVYSFEDEINSLYQMIETEVSRIQREGKEVRTILSVFDRDTPSLCYYISDKSTKDYRELDEMYSITVSIDRWRTLFSEWQYFIIEKFGRQVAVLNGHIIGSNVGEHHYNTFWDMIASHESLKERLLQLIPNECAIGYQWKTWPNAYVNIINEVKKPKKKSKGRAKAKKHAEPLFRGMFAERFQNEKPTVKAIWELYKEFMNVPFSKDAALVQWGGHSTVFGKEKSLVKIPSVDFGRQFGTASLEQFHCEIYLDPETFTGDLKMGNHFSYDYDDLDDYFAELESRENVQNFLNTDAAIVEIEINQGRV